MTESTQSIREVYPTFGRPHVLSIGRRYGGSLDCWCRPRLATPCPECGDSDAEPECWRCGGEGIVDVDYDDGVLPIMVIHNAADDHEQ